VLDYFFLKSIKVRKKEAKSTMRHLPSSFSPELILEELCTLECRTLK